MRSSLAVAFLLVVAGFAEFALTGSAQAVARHAAVGRIQIEYVPPKNPDHQALYEQLKERHALEKVQEILKPFRLPRDIKIQIVGCDGDANAWYEPVNNVPTITVCYEYLYVLWNHLPATETDFGLTPTDALVGQGLFVAFHEFGHLLFDVFHISVLGREEDAADNIATFLMLPFRQDARRLITGAAWSYHDFIKNYASKPNATLPLAAFSSNHGQPEERFYNMACIAYGSDPKAYADIVDKGLLPKSRAGSCPKEFRTLQFAFGREILPHIDRKMAAKVLATDWLATAPPPKAIR